MRIESLDSFPVRLARNHNAALGSAGSPARLRGQGDYRWAATYPCLYSTLIETALVRVRLDNGIEGWGEAQAPVAPEVACTIVEGILRHVIVGEEFDPTADAIARLWDRMYSAMRVRGQTGGFMLDAISGVDLALWDAAGRSLNQSVSALIGVARPSAQAGLLAVVRDEDGVPAYLSGIPGNDWDRARHWYDSGIRVAKIYYRASIPELLVDLDRAIDIFGRRCVCVDALWRLTPDTARELWTQLGKRDILFLECPFPPEETEWHIKLARETGVPIAVGESYRTRYELRKLIGSGAVRFLQPDLGRSGITEGLRIAELARQHAVTIVPHVSIAQAPQLAAAIHFAAVSGCPLLEFNPTILDGANRFLEQPIELRDGGYLVPSGSGLGIQFNASAPWSAF
jgi:D-galactarolactone cycloisomerase